MSTSKFQFNMTSTKPGISFKSETEADGMSLKNFRKIYFEDNITSLYPYGDVYYIDQLGIISDKIFFVEGMEFNIKLGYEEDSKKKGGWLEHNYVWVEGQLNNVELADNVAGDQIFILFSKHIFTDRVQSRSFNYEDAKKTTITDALKTVYMPFFSIPKEKWFISDTADFPYFNQYNETNGVFLQKLAQVAYSKNDPLAPFFTFINCNGEFYFMHMADLMRQQPVKEFMIGISETAQFDDKYIKEYNTFHHGMTLNKRNYINSFFTFENNELAIENRTIHEATDYISKDEREKLLVLKDYLKGDPTNNIYLGISHQQDSKEYFRGLKNSVYTDTNLSYRMTLMTQFDVKCIAGKTITIQVESQMKNKEIAVEYSGTWLIIKSKHLIDQDGVPYSKLTIAKPKIAIDSDHPFKKDF